MVKLYPQENCQFPAVVCVTGATSFVAGPIIERLLLAGEAASHPRYSSRSLSTDPLVWLGHVVHGTVRDPGRDDLIAPLRSMPGAADRLKIFKADLLVPGSFDEAMAGCEFVIHVASPFVMNVKPKDVQAKLLDPAVKGAENVLESVNRTETVKRQVLRTSIAT